MNIKVDKNTIIVFDLDDTLYNELDYLKSAYAEIAQKMDRGNWKLLYATLFSLYRSGADVFSFLSEKFNTPKEGLIKIYREHKPQISLFYGAYTLMTQIKAKHGKIGILTDGRSVTQRNKIKALGLTDFLDLLVISEEIGTEKPHTNNYLTFEKHFGAGNYFYIADNCKKDFVTPNSLGWQTIGLIDNGMNIHYDPTQYALETHIPNAFITTFTELLIA